LVRACRTFFGPAGFVYRSNFALFAWSINPTARKARWWWARQPGTVLDIVISNGPGLFFCLPYQTVFSACDENLYKNWIGRASGRIDAGGECSYVYGERGQ
jgi:hypothetical protein